MSDNNKFSVDKNSLDDSQQQVNNYTQSLDSLRQAVDRLSQPFNSLSNDLLDLNKSLSKYADSLVKINNQHITKTTSQTGVLAPFVIPGIIAETAIQVATIAAQKPPQYAKGGIHYQSDGRGALLPGYSRTDDTNAYLRSGEAVVVSEAMRNSWARNLKVAA